MYLLTAAYLRNKDELGFVPVMYLRSVFQIVSTSAGVRRRLAYLKMFVDAGVPPGDMDDDTKKEFGRLVRNRFKANYLADVARILEGQKFNTVEGRGAIRDTGGS